MSLSRRTVEDRLPPERMPLACTFGSPLDLHIRQSLSLQSALAGKGRLEGDLKDHRCKWSVLDLMSLPLDNFSH